MLKVHCITQPIYDKVKLFRVIVNLPISNQKNELPQKIINVIERIEMDGERFELSATCV